MPKKELEDVSVLSSRELFELVVVVVMFEPFARLPPNKSLNGRFSVTVALLVVSSDVEVDVEDRGANDAFPDEREL